MSHSERLMRAAADVARLRERIAADAGLHERHAALKRWQSSRLARTHADLLAEPRYRAAARFFLDDLYGANDLVRRDAELQRVIPVLARTLPDAALATLADAVELDALSEDLDVELTRVLMESADKDIDEAAYASAYRGSSRLEERVHQLDLVLAIGRSLDRLVRLPMLGMLLGAMGGPARMAGVAATHDFLMRGYDAFKGIGGASEFLQRIDRRERVVMTRLFDGAVTGWTEAGVTC